MLFRELNELNEAHPQIRPKHLLMQRRGAIGAVRECQGLGYMLHAVAEPIMGSRLTSPRIWINFGAKSASNITACAHQCDLTFAPSTHDIWFRVDGESTCDMARVKRFFPLLAIASAL